MWLKPMLRAFKSYCTRQVCKVVWIGLDFVKLVQTCLNLSEIVQTCPNLSEIVQIGSNLFYQSLKYNFTYYQCMYNFDLWSENTI